MSDVSIKIEIAGTEYPLRVKSEDAPNVQTAARIINEKVTEFEKTYTVKEKKDVLAMVLLQLVSEFTVENNRKTEEIKSLQLLLDELNQMVKNHQQKIGQ
jgi:cell division protein ZapA (FtsZ GTPase activity inhibitor)